MSAITVDTIAEQIKLVRDLRAKKTELNVPVKETNEAQKTAEARLIELLNESNLKTLKTEFGKATVVLKPSVKIPETPEAMMEFLDYVELNDPEVYKATVCMKSTDINEYYDMKEEQARTLGLDDLEIPGIGGLSYRETLSFTQA